MNLNRMHPFDVSWKAAINYREQRPLFNDMDVIRGKDKLIEYTVGEVDEALEEIDVPGQSNQEKVADELNDVFNMMAAVTVLSYGKSFTPSHHLDYVNGDGNHSNVFDRLKDTIRESEEDDRAVIETFRLLWSIAQHALDRESSVLVAQILRTYEKVTANYPKDLYDGTDPETGEVLTEEDKEPVFVHVTKSLKKIRAKVLRPLNSQDVSDNRNHIVDWKNSDDAIGELEQNMVLRDAPLTSTILESGIHIPTKETTLFITQNSGVLFENNRDNDSQEL